MSESTKLLQQFQREGYLFHGSPDSTITFFEPRIPVGTSPDQNPFNYDNAVFASDTPGPTVLFAIIDEAYLPKPLRKGNWSATWIDDRFTAKIPQKWRDFIESATGTVYILSRTPFKERQYHQFKSKVPVKPHAKVTVSLQDYFALGGTIEWTND